VVETDEVAILEIACFMRNNLGKTHLPTDPRTFRVTLPATSGGCPSGKLVPNPQKPPQPIVAWPVIRL
jgi:hypothetical protein